LLTSNAWFRNEGGSMRHIPHRCNAVRGHSPLVIAPGIADLCQRGRDFIG